MANLGPYLSGLLAKPPAPYTLNTEKWDDLCQSVNSLVLIGPQEFQEQLLEPHAELCSPPQPVLVKLCPLGVPFCTGLDPSGHRDLLLQDRAAASRQEPSLALGVQDTA